MPREMEMDPPVCFAERKTRNGASARKWRHGTKRATIVARRQRHGRCELTFWLLRSIRKGTKDMGETEVRAQVGRALGLWAQASRLNFRHVDDDDADIRVSFHA